MSTFAYIWPGTPVKLFENYYRGPCMEALSQFSRRYWRCSFQYKNERCALVREGHGSKGHQKADGKLLAPGNYTSDFDIAKTTRNFNDNLIQVIGDVQRKLEQKRLQRAKDNSSYDDDDEQAAIAELHGLQTKAFFDRVGNVDNFVSHLACFSCLRELPEHPLPCGHVLCTPCIEACGKRHGKSTVLLESCPLHSDANSWISPWEINIKPQYAGVRILSLDGYFIPSTYFVKLLIVHRGGARGIVELEVLKAIETELGGNLEIQAFLDLIVGTR